MQQHARKPIGNFLIKRELQMRLITKIVLSVVSATIISFATLLFVYYMKYQSIILYQMDQFANLKKENIVHILLPTLAISALVNTILATLVGMYASRKYAVPIYKLEKWARLLRQGCMTAKLQFREKDEMKLLSNECNMLSRELQKKFITIKQQTQELRQQQADSQALSKIEEIIDSLTLESETIEVNTAYMERPR